MMWEKQYILDKKNNKAITLIALIITIIVLLILAGVTLNMIVGNKGILNKANKADENTKYKTAYEELKLKILETRTLNNGKANLIDLIKELEKEKKYTYLIKFSQSALLDKNGEVNSDNIETDEIKNRLGEANEIYVTYKGYVFKIDNNLIIEERKSDVSYTIIYNLQGGTGELPNQIKNKGETIVLNSNCPTKEGYSFLGWSTSENGSVEYSAGANYDLDENKTLYAIWKHNHIAPTGGALVSGTNLSDNAEYNISGGCYTQAVNYTATCGSSSFTTVSVSGYSTYSGYSCGTCGSGSLVGGGNITIKCNACSAQRSGTIPSEHIWCRNSYKHIGVISNYRGTHSVGITIANLAGIPVCQSTVTKTKYKCNCGIPTDDNE